MRSSRRALLRSAANLNGLCLVILAFPGVAVALVSAFVVPVEPPGDELLDTEK